MNLSEQLALAMTAAPSTGCIVWDGAKSSRGYPMLTTNGKQVLVTRYVKAHCDKISIPDAAVVCRHTCDNPLCINPNHLVWGTMKNNSEDALERNRTARGEKLPRAKMTDKKVVEARAFFLEHRSLLKTRERYDLGINACRQMLMGTTWSHVPNAIDPQTYSEIVNRRMK